MAPDEKLYKLAEVAREARVSPSTVRRWLRAGKLPEPGKDRNGWRVWTQRELEHVIAVFQEYEEPAHERQAKLFNDDEEERQANAR